VLVRSEDLAPPNQATDIIKRRLLQVHAPRIKKGKRSLWMTKKPYIWFYGFNCVNYLGMRLRSNVGQTSEEIFRGRIPRYHHTDKWGQNRLPSHADLEGDVGPTFNMPEFIESAACLGFRRSLRVGNDLLVFASRLHRDAGDNDYLTNICLPTGIVSEAGETLKALGKGRSAALQGH
jgi:hypothetical protein